jgi:hypothetical protein
MVRKKSAIHVLVDGEAIRDVFEALPLKPNSGAKTFSAPDKFYAEKRPEEDACTLRIPSDRSRM